MKFTIVILLLAVLGLSAWQLWPANDEMAGWAENEALRVDLAGQLEVAKFRLEAVGDVRSPEELAKVVAGNEEREARISELKVLRAELTAAIVRGEENLVKLGEDHLRQLKERAIGREWVELVTASRTYQNAKVVSVTDSGVTIRHRDGSARLGYHDLTDSQREEFGLDEATAEIAAQEELKQALAYEQWLEDQLAAKERDKAIAAKVFNQATRSTASASRAVPVVSANVAPVKNPLKEPARQFGTGSRYYYGSSYYRPRRTNFYYYYNAPRYCAPRYCAPTYARPVFNRPPSFPVRSNTP